MSVKGVVRPAMPRTLGERVRIIRKAWGWTQEDLAAALGNDRQIVSYWELGKAKPTRSAAQLLAQVFGISLEALVSGEGFAIPDVPDPRVHALRRDLKSLFTQEPPIRLRTLDLAEGAPKLVSVREAKAFLEKAFRDGQTVWVIATGDQA